MIKILFEGNQFDIEEKTTLQTFVAKHGTNNVSYLVNGVAVAPDYQLQSYNVVEISTTGGTLISAASPAQMVEINLSDFTGRSCARQISNNIAAINELYNQPVVITVIRNGETVTTSVLENGDRVYVMPSGGVKGALGYKKN